MSYRAAIISYASISYASISYASTNANVSHIPQINMLQSLFTGYLSCLSQGF